MMNSVHLYGASVWLCVALVDCFVGINNGVGMGVGVGMGIGVGTRKASPMNIGHGRTRVSGKVLMNMCEFDAAQGLCLLKQMKMDEGEGAGREGSCAVLVEAYLLSMARKGYYLHIPSSLKFVAENSLALSNDCFEELCTLCSEHLQSDSLVLLILEHQRMRTQTLSHTTPNVPSEDDKRTFQLLVRAGLEACAATGHLEGLGEILDAIEGPGVFIDATLQAQMKRSLVLCHLMCGNLQDALVQLSNALDLSPTCVETVQAATRCVEYACANADKNSKLMKQVTFYANKACETVHSPETIDALVSSIMELQLLLDQPAEAVQCYFRYFRPSPQLEDPNYNTLLAFENPHSQTLSLGMLCRALAASNSSHSIANTFSPVLPSSILQASESIFYSYLLSLTQQNAVEELLALKVNMAKQHSYYVTCALAHVYSRADDFVRLSILMNDFENDPPSLSVPEPPNTWRWVKEGMPLKGGDRVVLFGESAHVARRLRLWQLGGLHVSQMIAAGDCRLIVSAFTSNSPRSMTTPSDVFSVYDSFSRTIGLLAYALRAGWTVDEVTFTLALAACAERGRWDIAIHVFAAMKAQGLPVTKNVVAQLLEAAYLANRRELADGLFEYFVNEGVIAGTTSPLDLHDMTLPLAKLAVRNVFLNMGRATTKRSAHDSRKDLVIITGRGERSTDNIPILKPAVLYMLRNQFVPSQDAYEHPTNPGRVLVSSKSLQAWLSAHQDGLMIQWDANNVLDAAQAVQPSVTYDPSETQDD